VEYEKIDFKYRIIKTFWIQTPMRPDKTVKSTFSTLATNGRLYFIRGFLWNGADWAKDTKNVMLPSAAHDSGCSMYLKGLIGDKLRREFDDFFKELMDREVEKGNMAQFRANYMYKAVKINTWRRYGIENP